MPGPRTFVAAPANGTNIPAEPTGIDRALWLHEVVRDSTAGAWCLKHLTKAPGSLTMDIATPGGLIFVDICPARPGARWYRAAEGLAFSYRRHSPGDLDPTEHVFVDRIVAASIRRTERLHAALSDLSAAALVSATARAHLDAVVAPRSEDVDQYRRDGFVLLRGVLDEALLRSTNPALQTLLDERWSGEKGPLDQLGGYSRAFVQLTNVSGGDALVQAIVRSRRVGSIAARLMGVSGVRIFCEDWLLKRSGDGPTGWHQDSCVFPFETEASITAWIPFQSVPAGMGLVQFVRGSQAHPWPKVENISAEATQAFEALLAERRLPVVTSPPVSIGDISFHDGRTVHGALGNDSGTRRDVLALHLFADGARVCEPATPTMRHMLNQFGPGLKPGDQAASPFWPLIYRDGEP